MNKEKFMDTVDGFFAYDSGATDSGINDKSKRAELKQFIAENGETADLWLNELVIDYLSSDG